MISVIMPVLDLVEMTVQCIQTLWEHTENFELIVIDNGSSPPFKPPFSGFNNIVIIRNEENLGFPAAVNQGINGSKGDIIIVMNNDVFVTTGWAEKLTDALNDYDIVGPVTNACAGLQKVQVDSYDDLDGLRTAADLYAQHYGDSVQDVNFVIGFCMAFKKSLFEELGQFDESLWPCSGEEVDFCFRAGEKGYRVGIVNGCYVHHECSKTFEILERDGKLNYAEVCKTTDDH